MSRQHLCSSDGLSSYVPQRIKSRIWEDQFIDLSLLVKSATELDDFYSQQEVQCNGRLSVVKRKQLTTDMRTSAFMIFMSIVLVQAQEMLILCKTFILLLVVHLTDISMMNNFEYAGYPTHQCPGKRSTVSFGWCTCLLATNLVTFITHTSLRRLV